MFELIDISKRFDAVVAINHASLKIEEGKVTALLGANGSGKSTMIKVLAGIVKRDSGEILLDGKPIQINNSMDSRKYGIATAFQETSLIATMTVKDNLVLGLESTGKTGVIDEKKDRQRVQELLDRFKISCDMDAYVQTLVPSTRSMLEVAKAVLSRPRLLLLDEVTASLHYDEINTLFTIIEQLKQDGVGIVYVTHRMKEIAQICDSATIMRAGKSVCSLGKDEFDLNNIVFHMTGKYPETRVNTRDGRAERPAGSMQKLLSVQGLKQLPNVKNIDFDLYRGEIVGIGGLDGQGQSEFIRTILGAQTPDAGKIVYKDREISYRQPADAINDGMGFVSGERNREAVFSKRTILENVFAGISAKGKIFRYIAANRMKQFAKHSVEKYRIKIGQLDDPISSLSGGNQQKVVIARWVAVNPELLLLDDPTKGVDIHSRREIHDILRECTREGMSVIISSSDNEELLEISERIYVFYEGKVQAVLSGESKTSERLVSAMMGLE